MSIPLPEDLLLIMRKQELIAKAFEKHVIISLYGNKNLEGCFQDYQGKLMFYYNDRTGSTHVVSE